MKWLNEYAALVGKQARQKCPSIKFSRPTTETGELPSTLIPCEPFTVNQYNLITDQSEERTVIGYAARISAASFAEFGVPSIPIHGGKFILIQAKTIKHGR